MHQPYIYTLPEQFIADKSVPLHWKLYTLINGFWISGNEVFASNSYFAKKLGCSERYIQDCLKTLEDMKLLRRDGVSQNRRILPWGANQQFVGGRTDSSKGNEPAAHHISVSNSDNLTISAEGAESERPKREKKDTTYLRVFDLWGTYPLSWRTHKAQIQAARNLLLEHGLDDIKDALEYIGRHKNDEFFPEIHSPWDLDTKWQKLEAFYEKRV